MKRLIFISLFALLLAAPMASQAGRSTRLLDHRHASFNAVSGNTLTTDKVREAIIAAGQSHGWKVVSEEPGQLIFHDDIRGQHQVSVKIIYDVSGMQVDYISSENLNYHLSHGEASIHPKYNAWVNLLIQGTTSRLSN